MPEKPTSDDLKNLRVSVEAVKFELRRLERRLEWLEQVEASEPSPPIAEPSISPVPAAVVPPPIIKPPPAPHDSLAALRKVHGLPPLDDARLRGSNAKKESVTSGTFEVAIGKTWLNRVGAFILLLGIGFFIKYAFDRGFISPTMRVLIGGATGLLLIAAGEYSIRKGMRQFAGGLLGAGSAILYFSTFSAHAFYQLISTPTTFALLCVVTAISTIMAVRGNLLGIAVLGLIGGIWTPLAVSTGRNEQVALLTYLVILDVGFLICGLIRQWHVLRVLTFLGTVALYAGWYDKFYQPEAMWVTLGFLACFYLIYLVEGQVAVRRGDAHDISSATLITSLCNAAFFGSVYYIANESLDRWMGLFAVCMGTLQFLIARPLLRRATGATVMVESLQIAGASFLALAAPLQFDKQLVVIAWSLQAVVTLCFCRGHDRPWLRIKACGIIGAALGHVFLYDFTETALNEKLLLYGNWYLTRLIALIGFLGLGAYSGAFVLAFRRILSKVDASLCAGLIMFGSVVMLWDFWFHYERYLASWWWVGLAVFWYLISMRSPRLIAVYLIIVSACVGKYFVDDTCWSAITEGSWSGISGICFNRMFLTGLLIAGVTLLSITPAISIVGHHAPGSYWHTFLHGESFPRQFPFLAAFIFTWAGSFEVARVFRFEPWRDHFNDPLQAGDVFLTGWWVLNAVALWVGVRTRKHILSSYALVLTWWCVAWFSMHDTIHVAMSDAWSVLQGIASNRTFILGLVIVANTFLAYAMRKRAVAVAIRAPTNPAAVSALLVAAVSLTVWLPTFEIIRVFTFEPARLQFVDPGLAMQVFLSVFWALAAIFYLCIGFARMIAVLRYVAIAMFGVTVCKVMLIDMANLEMIYRIVSFIVLGLLLLLASLLYQKLSERILHPVKQRPEGLE